MGLELQQNNLDARVLASFGEMVLSSTSQLRHLEALASELAGPERSHCAALPVYRQLLEPTPSLACLGRGGGRVPSDLCLVPVAAFLKVPALWVPVAVFVSAPAVSLSATVLVLFFFFSLFFFPL